MSNDLHLLLEDCLTAIPGKNHEIPGWAFAGMEVFIETASCLQSAKISQSRSPHHLLKSFVFKIKRMIRGTWPNS